jgi:hypothetical protein
MSNAFIPNQGYDKALNLSETRFYSGVMNNLGGGSISNDIVLFLNNLRNTSTLLITNEDIVGSFIRLLTNTSNFVFTNGTRITINGNIFFVGDSNNVDEFRLYTNDTLTNLVNNPNTGLYIRSDAIAQNDIRNLVRFRDLVVENEESSQILARDTTNISSNSLESIYTSYIRTYELRSGFLSGLTSYINAIEAEIDLFTLRKVKSVLSTLDFEVETPLSITGNIYVSDPDGVNNSTISSSSGPGIFILNPENNTKTRIFSSNENLWEDLSSTLSTSSKEIFVGSFVFDQEAKIIRKPNDEFNTTNVMTPITSFTHFVKVFVNGEEYSLCLLKEVSPS